MGADSIPDGKAVRRRWPLACAILLCTVLTSGSAHAVGSPDSPEDAPPASRPATQPTTQPATQPASQPASQPTATAPASQPREPELTAEMVATLRKQAEAGEAENKQAILDLYDQALKHLESAEQWAAQAARFEKAREQAPALAAAVREKMAQPAADLTPRVPDGATLAQIEQLFQQAEEQRRAAYAEVSALRDEWNSAQERQKEIPKRLAAIRQQRNQLRAQLGEIDEDSSELEQARRACLQAQLIALRQENTALSRQIANDEARRELLTDQQDLASRHANACNNAYDAWKRIVEQRRAAEAHQVAAQASQRSDALRDQPALHAIAEQNKLLAGRRIELQKLAEEIQQALPSQADLYQQRSTIQNHHKTVRQKIETGGLTEAISSLLRRHRSQLPDLLQHERNRRRLQTELSRAQLELIDLEDQRAGLIHLDRQVEQILKGLRGLDASQRRAAEAALRDLLQTQRRYLDDLIRDYNTCVKTWTAQDEVERSLIDEAREYRDYIDEHILWVRSTRPLQLQHALLAWRAVQWLAAPAGWREVAQAVLYDVKANPLVLLLGMLLLALLVSSRRQLRLRLQAVHEMASKSYTYAFTHTLEAMGLTVLLAIPWPGLLWFVGWRLSAALTLSDLTGALAAGLRTAAGLFLVLEVSRQMCRPKGIGQAHFHWPAEAMQLLWQNLRWLMPVVIPLAMLGAAIEWQGSSDHKDSLGRLVFVAGMITLSILARRVLDPKAALLAGFLRKRAGGWPQRLRYVWYPLAVAMPAALAIAALAGYAYTAGQMASRMLASIALVFGALVVRALLLRLLFVGRRRLAIEAVHKRQAAQAQAEAAAAPAVDAQVTPQGIVPVAAAAASPPEVDLATVDAQTRRLVRVGIWIGLAAGLYFLWADMLPALGFLDRVRLWSTTVETVTADGGKVVQALPITLGRVTLAGLTLLVAIAAARNIPGLLEITVLRLLPLEPGGRYAINAISRYALTIVGLIIAFGWIGIGWTKVQWLAAAVTVGLGFGLQEIFANFVSGLIILFERPVRVGDVVTVGGISGTVSRIRIRATTIIDQDRKELVVPNKQFITGQLVNWTLSDRTMRVAIAVGVPYGTDIEQVRCVLLQAARQNPRVLANPQPACFFQGFADNRLNFLLQVFVPSPEQMMIVEHELHAAIDTALCREDIKAAFSRKGG